jgi:hypothetical protein
LNFVSCFIFKGPLLYNAILTRKGNHIKGKERREEMTVLMIAGLIFWLNLFTRTYFLLKCPNKYNFFINRNFKFYAQFTAVQGAPIFGK